MLDDIRHYVDRLFNQYKERLREIDPRQDSGQIPPRARLFKWLAPVANRTYFTYTGSDASPMTSAITDPDVPRGVQVTWSATWTGGWVEVDYLFDGKAHTKRFTANPNATDLYPDTPITKILQVRKQQAGAGTAVFASLNSFGIESNNRPVEQLGMGMVDGAADITDGTTRSDGRVVIFTVQPNGSRKFIYGVNVL